MSQSVRFEQVVKVVNEFARIGESRGLGKLYTEDRFIDGRVIYINNKKYINLGSCSYLGLETDRRLKEAAIEAVRKYGVLFSSSRIFVSSGNYKTLEELTQQMFGNEILITTTVSMGHQSVMPIIIGGNDSVIFDQQAHFSMQDMTYKLSYNGSDIFVLRHNRMDELDKKIEEMKAKYDKIWYVVDGVYSMFGDLSPIKELIGLLDKHKKFYLYVDDAHGMSWAGTHGTGYVLGQTDLHPKMVLGTTMAKGFGSCGGVFVFKDKELRDKVRHWGGPLSHSGPQEPATVAASVASAKIHLTDEIYDLQFKLFKRIKYCNEVMEYYKIPMVSKSQSPIFFIGCGLPKVGFNMIERLMAEGFYTNIGIFPAVPENCTGVRFTMTNHISYSDIEQFAKAVAKNLPLAMKDEERSMQDIYKAFRKFTDFESRIGPPATVNPVDMKCNSDKELVFDTFHSISHINKDEWNAMFIDKGAFDYDTLMMFEQVFSSNPEKENNWQFFYYLIRNKGKLVAATFFTLALVKDDMLSAEQISEKIEKVRQDDPYFLTSSYFSMGTQLSYGNHLYLDKSHPLWKNAMTQMLEEVWKEQEKNNASVVMLRDFENNDDELTTYLIDNGFVKIDIGTSCAIDKLKNTGSFETYYQTRLNKKKRLAFRNDIRSKEHLFTVEIDQYNNDDLKGFYKLYLELKKKNLKVNSFTIPFKFFAQVAGDKHWEIVTLRHAETGKVASVTLCAKNEDHYHPIIIGIDYSFGNDVNVYKQSVYRLIVRSIELNVDKLHLGLTAIDAKYNLGAEKTEHIAFIQKKDSYNQDLIDSMSFGE
jgi:7-keto-8-aminopelargonate synthetase-like enzyme